MVTEGEKRGKTLSVIRDKFLDGFPESFNIVVIPERNSTANAGVGNFVHPVNYPAHYPAALAGQPHPNAGEPDMDAMATNFNITWVDYIVRGLIQVAPKGSAYQVSEQRGGSQADNEPEEDSAPETASQVMMVDGTKMVCQVSASSITPDTVCVTCGGRGHMSRVDDQTCLTTVLGIKVPREELEKTTYPAGITFPKLFRRPPVDRPSTTTTRNRTPANPKSRVSSGYRSNDEKKVKDRVRAATIESKPDSSSGEDVENQKKSRWQSTLTMFILRLESSN